ncbi:MAG: hypothetical protein A3G32_08545 [Deltaproteobacteria bacterium RIFCSPLOWO2_12_FULL_40_28]|nr:MAG: hypothetical protein A3C45_01245 [Deltaproteobacteria bacterium RIFCSPHIGHO2_02_FULL_40_28]OGQ20952.1 MAG: hypothetical protein A3E27_03910 [Deltaproteobacteria bacterium RIFCSPHIGHO2_12_FULL_40_32]OGQ39353.1 MAG: hypothetical protein A3I69_05270 [Deltaproteobacteria bacterium RIFCSPLOWO2_02_FULL_40_36]OGQ54634.1 MAG: hypothetical protein A3G32_08545 [Deltaproteobacteria bacterium RIFCSPLOWO2_12_FULL_40_28]
MKTGEAFLLIQKAIQSGGEYADVFLESKHQTHIVLENKTIDQIFSGKITGAAIRVISEFKNYLTITQDISIPNLLKEANLLATSIKKNKRSPKSTTKGSACGTSKISPPSSQVGLKKIVTHLKKIEKLAWKMSPHSVQVKLSYSDSLRAIEMATSDFSFLKQSTPQASFSVLITVSKKGKNFTGFHSLGGQFGSHFISLDAFEECALLATQRAITNMSAKTITGGVMPVVISSSSGGTLIHEAIGHGLEADLALEGLSVYKNKLGEKVASSKVTITDNPTLQGKRGSYMFDDEGIRAQNTILIEKGILKNFLCDRLHALKFGLKSNAHGRREDFTAKPIVRMANTMMLPGPDDPQKILSSVNHGLFVTMMGGGEVNTVNGDFVFEVTEGYLIENGKKGEPVRGVSLVGNAAHVLASIDLVGSDFGFSVGTCEKDGQDVPITDGMPTVRIPLLTVGGSTSNQ